MIYRISRKEGSAIFVGSAKIGCAFAHMCASTKPLGSYILEEDATSTDHMLYKNPYSCDMLYYGLSSSNLRYTILDENFARLRYCLGTHAYSIESHHGLKLFREACLESIQLNKHLDICLAERMEKMTVIGYRKPIWYQGPESNRYSKLTNIVI